MSNKLYCPACKEEVDEIFEHKQVKEYRVWDGECYALVNSDEDGEIITVCTCGCEVEER